MLSKKVSKAFDEKDAELATALRKVEALEAQVEAGRARTRMKVKLSPNSKFADIEAIHKAQLEAGEIKDNTAESSDSDLPSEAGSCILVASKVVEK